MMRLSPDVPSPDFPVVSATSILLRSNDFAGLGSSSTLDVVRGDRDHSLGCPWKSTCLASSQKQFSPLYLPIVMKSLSPTSPKPGVIMPFTLVVLSSPPNQISVPSGHSFAALITPPAAPRTARTMIFSTPQSLRIWMAAAQVPPVAMTGSRMNAILEAEVFLCGPPAMVGPVVMVL